ncbi:ABC transporter ATP-binding protein [Oleispirillum naphthae]|uniref:ABC transporter ATP-binding protein n=1 Tax=Oleispirillum naphthae TaxID=2838853 RepID=UPI00308223C5
MSPNPTVDGVPLLQVENIHKRFGGNEVLKGVSLSARTGDVISILGSSGSGKSTFLRCINYLETPDKGRVILGGEEIHTKTAKDGRAVPADHRQLARLRARIGFVFQSFNLWPHLTVLENVIEAPVQVARKPRKEAAARAEAMLARVGLSDHMGHYPAHLSGGQQQRAAIARTLVMDPEVILFDEPTSALDPELVGEVLLVMRSLAEEGRTMLIVTHEMGFAREVSNWVMFLHEGKVEEQGPPEKIFNRAESERVRQFMSSHVS